MRVEEIRRLAERHWVVPHSEAWLQVYQNSVLVPERRPLRHALRRLAPFASVVDIGCHCGVIMPLILAASPHAKVTGVDLSRQALDRARQIYPDHQWVEASFVDWLPLFVASGKQAEVIIGSSALGHIIPDTSEDTFAALGKAASRAIVIQAQMALPGYPEMRVDSSGVWEWRYDYARRLAAYGWRVASANWAQVHGPQPNALMVFERSHA